jgi:hypothetical protein
MKWTKLNIAVSVIALLIVTNLVTLILLLNRVSAHHPGNSKPVGNLKIEVERNDNSDATPEFKFTRIPAPSPNDAATSATFSLITGGQDGSNWRLRQLHDGILPGGPDAPDFNFFFGDGSYGGRVLVDLNQPMDIQQINSYSWHVSDRAPQLYKLYAHEALPDGSNLESVGNQDPATLGWKLLANVDTRPKSGPRGGQYGVSISSPNGIIGHYRYLLFDCRRTEDTDRWGNTFYSEIDVIAK